MKKYFFFALLLLLCTTQNVFAQESEQALIENVDLEDATVIANIELENVSFIEQVDRLVRFDFDVVNEGKTVQPDIRYSVQLAEQLPAPDVEGVMHNFTVNEIVYEDVISLNSGERASRNITYDVPAVFSGDYVVILFVTTTDGVPLAITEVENINVDSSEGVLLNNCAVLIEGDNTQYSVDAGADIDTDESVYVQCDVKNLNNTDISFKPQFLSYEGSIFGTLLGQEILQVENLVAGEMRNMKWQIPKEKKPQAYDAALQLLSNDGIILSNIVPVHYVVRGESGTILNAQLDKSQYASGDTASILFDIAGRADLFFGSRAHGEDVPDIEPQDAYYSVEIYDGNGNICGSATDQKMDFAGALVERNVHIKNKCVDPVVAVTLVNSNKEVLDEAEFVIKSESSEPSTAITEQNKNIMQMLFYGVLVVTGIGIIVILLMAYKKRKGNGVASFIIIMIGCGLLFSHNANAISFYVPPPAPWAALGYAMYVTAGATPVCDATSTKITGAATIRVCNNASINAYVYIDGTRVLHKYCPKQYLNCGTYSFSKWDGSNMGSNSVLVRADYKLSESKWDQSNAGWLYYTVYPCPPKESCGSSHKKTFISRPTSGLCGEGSLRWIDTVANDGTWNWKCGSLNCYANRSRTLTGVLTVSATCLPHTGGSASVNLSVGSIGGTARGDIEYRYDCGSGFGGWTSSSTHMCSYSSIGNKTVRAQIGRDGVTSNTNAPIINISYCPADGVCSSPAQIDIPSAQTETEWNNLPNTYFCTTGSPVIRPNFPDYGESVTWDCNGIYDGDPTVDGACSAKRLYPQSECAEPDGEDDINIIPKKPPYPLCASENEKISGVDTTNPWDGIWRWSCSHEWFVGPPAHIDPSPAECSAKSCLADKVLNYPAQVYLTKDGQSVNVSVFCDGTDGDKMCCDIGMTPESGTPDTHICSGESGEFVVPDGSGTYPAECYFKDGCETNIPNSCPKVDKPITIQTMCMAKSCNAQGTCQATPVAATSLDSADCNSSCNSNADCSSGRIIETKP